MIDPDIPAESMYREHILDHYTHPRNYGEIKNASTAFSGRNPLCGDEVKIELKIEKGRIVDVGFVGGGCAISKASASLITEGIKGKTIEEVKKMKKEDVLKLLEIPISPVRLKCALLSFKVLENAITAYEKKRDEHG
ncbi:MAG: Fe-S cluster assembly sulfur transfer protein SufU [Nanoarchaeota archaeon]